MVDPIVFNKELADRIRLALARPEELTEKRMFGGIALMLRGNMCWGVY